MAKETTPLTDKEIKAARAKEKEYKLFDGGGLYLSIMPTGGKLWRLKYRFDGKEKRIALGAYPTISLAAARKLREDNKTKIALGTDPAEERNTAKAARLAEESEAINTLNGVAAEYLNKIKGDLSAGYYKKLTSYFENNVQKVIGEKPISSVTRSDLQIVIDKIEEREAIEVAKKTINLLERIFKYAVTTDKAPHNIVADLDKKYAIKRRTVRHHPTITDRKGIKGLLAAIDGYQGDYVTKCALQIAPYVALRPGELRAAEWSEIDFENALWKIPAKKMKMRKPHIVPLVPYVIEVLKELHKYTGHSKYVFTNAVYKDRFMSENTLNYALRRMGFTKDEIVSHGFRSMFSTIAHEHMGEHGHSSDVIERQLAHSERNTIKAAYNHAEHLQARKELMQWWSDYLDGVKGEK
ncbi:tyrosine-type recombinase/integrase [Sulfurovum sp.]|uniref:tyrosine-type recombinase/integrase n=1 Tax=Sulfurovum sp. TaxID=1969726 RepID=UPI0035670851